jgi:exosortase K
MTPMNRLLMAALYAAGAAVAYALKTYYSGANADDLRWVLGPTCWLAAHLGGMTFVDEAGAGFISHAQHLVVGPACSGLNFMIACFAALFFSFAHRFGKQSRAARAAWLPACLVLSWAGTVATNALRVTLAAPLYQADIYGDLVTPARVHRLLGTALYCGALVVIHGAVARRFAAPGAGRSREARFHLHALSPFAFYLGLVLVVPLLRRGLGGFDARFIEHTAMVAGTVLLLVGGVVIAKRLANRLQSSASRGVPAS